LGWNTVLPDQNFRFCGQKASLFCIWKPVLLQCLFLNRATKLSICSHQSLNKKKRVSFWWTAHICFVLHKKKIRDDGCWLLKNFTGPNQLYKVFLWMSPFQKKNRRFKKTKKSIAKGSDKFFGLFFCYNKVCFCPWSFFTWKKITVFFEKKKINVNLFQL